MIVQDHKAEEGAMHILLFDRELRRLVELLDNPKRRVSDEAKEFASKLRAALKDARKDA